MTDEAAVRIDLNRSESEPSKDDTETELSYAFVTKYPVRHSPNGHNIYNSQTKSTKHKQSNMITSLTH